MTVKSILDDPVVDEVTAVFGDGEVLEGELEDYDNQVSGLKVGGTEKWNPVEIDVHGNSVVLKRVPESDLSYFPFAGRDYSSIDYDKEVMSQPALRRTPAVLEDDNYVFEGNSFLKGFRDQSVENELWVRVFDFPFEDAFDYFIGDHFPYGEELQDREEGRGFYNDEELRRTFDEMSSCLHELDFSYMKNSERFENYHRLESNMERLGYDLF